MARSKPEVPDVESLDAVQLQRDPDWPAAGSIWEDGERGVDVEVIACAVNDRTGEWSVVYRDFRSGHVWTTPLRRWFGKRDLGRNKTAPNFKQAEPVAADA